MKYVKFSNPKLIRLLSYYIQKFEINTFHISWIIQKILIFNVLKWWKGRSEGGYGLSTTILCRSPDTYQVPIYLYINNSNRYISIRSLQKFVYDRADGHEYRFLGLILFVIYQYQTEYQSLNPICRGQILSRIPKAN